MNNPVFRHSFLIHFQPNIAKMLLTNTILSVYCIAQADLYIMCNMQILLGRFISQLTAGQWISIDFSPRKALPGKAQKIDDRKS